MEMPQQYGLLTRQGAEIILGKDITDEEWTKVYDYLANDESFNAHYMQIVFEALDTVA